MEISLHTMLWIVSGLFIFAIVVGYMRRKQMQRAADLFADTEQNQAHQSNELANDQYVGQYGDQIIGKARDVNAMNAQAASESVMNKISPIDKPPIIVMFLKASEGHQFGGYELQQTLANAGLIYGDMKIFHRHEEAGGRGQRLFSVASAVGPGIIDIDNIGSFSTTGLCLVLDCKGNPFPLQSFTMMVHTARQLSEDLGGQLLDEQRKPWTKAQEAECRDTLQLWTAPQAEQKIHTF